MVACQSLSRLAPSTAHFEIPPLTLAFCVPLTHAALLTHLITRLLLHLQIDLHSFPLQNPWWVPPLSFFVGLLLLLSFLEPVEGFLFLSLRSGFVTWCSCAQCLELKRGRMPQIQYSEKYFDDTYEYR